MAADVQAAMVQSLLDDTGFAAAPFTDRERALVAYADKLTRTPAAIRRTDLDLLRAHGLDDRVIHDACSVVAYFAFVNRIADGLGVEFEGSAPNANES